MTGLLLAFNLPSNLPVWIIIIGALVAIGIGKMTFGGLGCNPFNPALVGRVFLLISFPVQMTSWPLAGQWAAYTDAETGATPLALMKQAVHGDASALGQLPDTLSFCLNAWAMSCGCLGEDQCTGSVYRSGLYAMEENHYTGIFRYPSWLQCSYSSLMHLANPAKLMHRRTDPLAYRWFDAGSHFMATDYVTSPMTHKGMLIYGVAIGFLTVVIRLWCISGRNVICYFDYECIYSVN